MKAEAAGEAAAVCCCCPFGVACLVVMTAVRLPAVIFRRAQRLRRRRRKKMSSRSADSGDGFEGSVRPLVIESWPSRSAEAEVLEKEMEMWARFHNAGFWRSLSQRE